MVHHRPALGMSAQSKVGETYQVWGVSRSWRDRSCNIRNAMVWKPWVRMMWTRPYVRGRRFLCSGDITTGRCDTSGNESARVDSSQGDAYDPPVIRRRGWRRLRRQRSRTARRIGLISTWPMPRSAASHVLATGLRRSSGQSNASKVPHEVAVGKVVPSDVTVSRGQGVCQSARDVCHGSQNVR